MDKKTLDSVLRYEPSTGKFFWIEARAGVRAGDHAGCVNAIGYLVVCIDYKLYLCHRLVWLHLHGEWPRFIDHIDGDRINNRAYNLRDVSQKENARNATLSSRSTSGVTGIHAEKWSGKWLATIRTNDKHINLGRFVLFDDAVAARKAAEVELGFHPNHGKPRRGSD